MAEFIVNEINHVVDMDEQVQVMLREGEILPDGFVIGETLEHAGDWQIYITEDGSNYVLAVSKKLASLWIEGGFLPKRAILDYVNEKGDQICLFFSPTSLILQAVGQVRFYGSSRYAASFAGAMWHSRSLNHKVNLRDGIFCELFSVILPTFSITREVADRAIFCNCLQKNTDEDISSSKDMKNPGLSFAAFREILKEHGYAVHDKAPLLSVGELVDDYVQTKEHTVITSALEVTDNYEIYSTNQDVYILLLQQSFADMLIDNEVISQIYLKNIQVGSKVVYAKALSKRFALETLNARHYGINLPDAFTLCSVIGKTHREYPYARIADALYVQELKTLLPVDFRQENESIYKIAQDILHDGPFALAPFAQDDIDNLVGVATR
ncbi:hypothetical protein [Anaerobiospirillum thomasii]|uniref:Uncharacterized protein n=1 Tax=Anaerobiospirillum thomasii TaxID=179995 RepID=A0A2X0V403_9GAMM|nr:hypothetical protein [Anaerobiospirillum thomasii]SPT69244.1 Uncharacterised protein [Anaerobiospirillum thomasii]